MVRKVINIVVVVCLFVSFNIHAQNTQKINIDIYFEPFNTSGWQSFVYLDLIKRKNLPLNINVYPFVRKTNNSWFSSYGEGELKEAARFEALKEKYPSKFFEYLRVRILSMSPEGWKDALIYAGIDPVEFDNYVEKNRDLLLENAYNRLKKSVIEKPGVYIADQYFEGFIKITDAMDRVNFFLPQDKKMNLFSQSLSKIKPPKFIVVSDDTNLISIDNNIINSFRNIAGELAEEKINYSKLEPALKEKIFSVPAYLIEKKSNIKEYLSQAVKQGIMEDIGDFYVYYDVRNIAKILNARKEDGKLEMFIMSQCPFGVKALESVIDYIESGKIDKSKFSLHFIGDFYEEKGDYRFSSLHGDEEWKENMRQLVILKYYPDKFFRYVKNRIKNYSSPNWQDAANSAEINIDDLNKKIETDGKKLLAEDFKYTSSYRINVSPTFIINGETVAVGISNLKKFKGYEDIKIDVSNSDGGCGK